MERQAKGQESQSSMQDELGGARAHDDGHPPGSSLWVHGARSIQCTGQRHVQKPEVGHGFGKDQACRISTVAWFWEATRETQTAARVEQISEWISMWRNCNVQTRRRIRKVWRKKAPILAGNSRRWNQAAGPISTTICSVLEAGWKPSTPGFWQTPDGSATLDGALFNKAQIIDSDMEMQTWKTAARHTSSSVSQLIKEGNFMAARALDFLVCGAINEPLLPVDGPIPNHLRCVRCDLKAPATRKHEPWECAGNTFINHTHMKESEYLTSVAQAFWDTDQVLFARGLLPRDWLPASEFAKCNEVRMWESVDFDACAKNHVLIASDGSGGSRKTPQTLRQVAFGVATFDVQICSDTSFTLQHTGNSGGQLPGRQTVPRAELWGAIQILSRVDRKTNIQIPIDAKYVTRGIIHRGDLEQGSNGDLWTILFQLIDGRSGVTDVIKVKSHLEDAGPSVIKQNKIACHHMLANSLADVVAGLNGLDFEWQNVWRWCKQTFGPNEVKLEISTNWTLCW